MKEKRKRSGRAAGVVSVLLCVLLFPVILVNVIIIANTYLHPDEIPGAFGVKPVAVLSGSMEDTFMTGDLIFLHKTDPANLQEGDVICYLASGQAVTHRIVRVERDGGGATRYITKGDANNAGGRRAGAAPAGAGDMEGRTHRRRRKRRPLSLQHHGDASVYRLPDLAADRLGYHHPAKGGQKRKGTSGCAGSGVESAAGCAGRCWRKRAPQLRAA